MFSVKVPWIRFTGLRAFTHSLGGGSLSPASPPLLALHLPVGARCPHGSYFDSHAYACGLESGLGHCAYGTFGKSLHPVVLCPVWPMSEDACAWCRCRDLRSAESYASSAQPQPVK